MQYKPLHCWDCGTQVIGGEQGKYESLSNMRQVKFSLSDSSYCESPFCHECAERPWTVERCAAFKAAVDLVSEHFRPLQILAVNGQAPLTEPILAVLSETLAGRANRLSTIVREGRT